MTNVIALLAFVGFVVLGLGLVAVRGRIDREAVHQRAVSLLVAYVLVVGLTALVSQRDLWPFAAWRLVLKTAPTAVTSSPGNESLRIVAIDATEREHLVDYRAWQPLSIEELTAWMAINLRSLDSADTREVGAHLLTLANEGRRRASRGEVPGVSDRIFGPLAPPTELLHPRRWSDRADVPAAPFVGIRVYREEFALEELRRGDVIRLERVLEYREPAP